MNPAQLDVPTVTGGTYNGSVINAGYAPDGRITVSEETSGTDAGEYAIVFALADTHNYVWTDGTTAEQTVTWKIEQAVIAAPSQSNALTYNEKEQSAEFRTGLRQGVYRFGRQRGKRGRAYRDADADNGRKRADQLQVVERRRQH